MQMNDRLLNHRVYGGSREFFFVLLSHTGILQDIIADMNDDRWSQVEVLK